MRRCRPMRSRSTSPACPACTDGPVHRLERAPCTHATPTTAAGPASPSPPTLRTNRCAGTTHLRTEPGPDSGQSLVDGPSGQLDTVVQLQLLQGVLDVVLHGAV